MKKKTLSALLTAAMATGLLAGRGSGDRAAKTAAPTATIKTEGSETAIETAVPEGDKKYDGAELTYQSMQTNQKPQGQAPMQAAEAFEAEAGAKVKFEWKGHKIKNILSSALGAQEKFDMFEDDYTGISKSYMNYVADLTAMAEEVGYADKSYPVFSNQATEWAGFLPCVTEQPSVDDALYNRDIFNDCDVTAPKAWAEFMAACQTMRDKSHQPLALDSTYAPFLFDYHLSRHIGQAVVEELATNSGWSSNPDVTKAGQEMIDFVKTGYLTDGAPDEYPASQNRIDLTDKVGMIVCANYITSEVNTNTGSKISWGLFAYPTMDDGVDDSSTFAGANSIGITKYSRDQQAVFDFALYLTSGKQGQNFADLSLSIPADPNNTVPTVQSGTMEVLVNTAAPLSWNMSLNANADKIPVTQEAIVKLYEGSRTTGDDFTKVLDALY